MGDVLTAAGQSGSERLGGATPTADSDYIPRAARDPAAERPRRSGSEHGLYYDFVIRLTDSGGPRDRPGLPLAGTLFRDLNGWIWLFILDLVDYFPDFNMTLEEVVGSNSTDKR